MGRGLGMVIPQMRWRQPQKPGKGILGWGTTKFLYLQNPTTGFGPGENNLVHQKEVELKLV